MFKKSLLILLLFLTACASTSNGTPTSGEIATRPPGAYPAPGIPGIQGYPAPGGDQPTPTPGYMGAGFITATPDAGQTPLIIASVQHEGTLEIFTIKNIGQQAQDISGYMLFSPNIAESYMFPVGLTLASGDTYTVYNGATGGKPQEQIWLDAFALNEPMDEVWLLNRAARIIYTFIYYP